MQDFYNYVYSQSILSIFTHSYIFNRNGMAHSQWSVPYSLGNMHGKVTVVNHLFFKICSVA